MTAIEEALQVIRRVVDELGTVEAARQSGIPYTTLHEARRRDFTGPSIKTFQRLAAFAEEYEREHRGNGVSGRPGAAA